MKPLIAGICVYGFFSFQAAGQATITIRLLDANTGKARKYNKISVLQMHRYGLRNDSKLISGGEWSPNNDGSYSVRLFSSEVNTLSFDLPTCSLVHPYAIRDIVSTGLNAGSTCTKPKATFKPNDVKAAPGELILFLYKDFWGQW